MISIVYKVHFSQEQAKIFLWVDAKMLFIMYVQGLQIAHMPITLYLH